MTSISTRVKIATSIAISVVLITAIGAAEDDDVLVGHPRPSYENVEDIDAMAEALRKSLAGRASYSFSRGW